MAINRNSLFPAFSHRNFRLFFIGQCVSLIGTWMQNIGQQLLVQNTLHGSPSMLGLVTAVQFLPMLLFALFAGTFVDKFPKRRVLLFTQSSLAVLALILAALTFFGVVRFWHVLVLASLLGLVNTLDMPTRQSFFVEMVGREDLMNAIALNSTIFNLARFVGPAVAGVLIELTSISACFFINALSFVAVITSLAMMRLEPPAAKPSGPSAKTIMKEIGEGLSYIRCRSMILQPLILLAVASAFVMNFTTVLPFYSSDILKQGPAGYGFLMASMGVGSFLGALLVAARSRSGPRAAFLVGGALGMSALLAMAGVVSNYFIACAVLFLLGFCAITFTTLVNSTIQLNSEDHMRGRVMSVYSLVFGGMSPIGGLYAGWLTQWVGAPLSMIVSGGIGIVAAAFAAGGMRGRKKEPTI